MKKITLYQIVTVLCFSLLPAGCMYSDGFGPNLERFAALYGASQWRQDTGWTDQRIQEYMIPVWNVPKEAGARAIIGGIHIGKTAKVLGESQASLQIINPATSEVGWLDKIYVRRTFSTPVAKAAGVSPVSQGITGSGAQVSPSQTGTLPASGQNLVPVVDPATSVQAKRVVTKNPDVVIAAPR